MEVWLEFFEELGTFILHHLCMTQVSAIVAKLIFFSAV
jgi:hypothetical protein